MRRCGRSAGVPEARRSEGAIEMDFAWSPEDLAFKEELEAFLDKEMPPFIEQ